METLTNSVVCIIKERDLRPKSLFIDNFDNQTIALKPVPGIYQKPLWFPKNIVFKYDDRLFEELKKAYEKHNNKLLEQLWAEAKYWEPEENSK